MNNSGSGFWDLPPSGEWWNFGLIFAGIAALIAAGETVRLLARWSPEFTRKLVHVSVGILIFFAPDIFTTAVPAVLLAVVFMIANFVAIRFGLLKGMHGTDRPTYGTVYYPLSFLILVLVFWYRQPMIISVSILVLALGDAAAAVVGEARRSPVLFSLSRDKKSLEGSVTMFGVSFAVLFFGLRTLAGGIPEHALLAVAGIGAMTATAWEALCSRGLDNLFVPLSVAFVLSYLFPYDDTTLRIFAMGTGFALIVALASYWLKFLSLSGAVATFLLASIVFGIGGWKWTIPILVFFLLSSLLSRVGKQRKASAEMLFEKSGTRDWAQVFANGGIGGILVLASWALPGIEWYLLYLGSLAAVTADTWGTEIGLLSRRQPFLITTMKSVEPGSSGGITWLGLLGGLLGSFLIGLSALPWSDATILPWILLAGLTGTVVDSVLGATVQGSYRCPVCGRMTERKVHCEHQPTVRVRGLRWIDNDAVNWGCAFTGAAVMIVPARAVFW